MAIALRKILNMPTKTRIIIVGILILLGAACFCYFAFIHPKVTTTQAQVDSTTAGGPQAASVKAASTAVAEQDQSAQASQTRSERRSRPRSGST
jgi:hypothetical protein